MSGAIRWRYVLLLGWTTLWMALTDETGRDWQWFRIAGNLLLLGRAPGVDWLTHAPTGLHVYGLRDLHIGPFSILASLPFRLVPAGGDRVAAAGVSCLGGLLVVLVAERAALRARGLRSVSEEPLLALTILIAGGAFLVSWANGTWYWGHLDEALAVAGGALAVWGIVTRRATLTGVGVGLAIGAKLTGIFFLPLLFCFPRRQVVRALVPAVLIAGVAWLPFLVAEPGSFRSASTIDFAANSPLHLLGLSGGDVPGWLRPLQVTIGVGLGLLAVARGQWPAAIVVAGAARLALDPATFGYYNLMLFFGAVVFDLLGPRRPLPIMTLAAAAAFLVAPDILDSARAEGAVRLLFAASLAIALLLPLRGDRCAGAPRTATSPRVRPPTSPPNR